LNLLAALESAASVIRSSGCTVTGGQPHVLAAAPIASGNWLSSTTTPRGSSSSMTTLETSAGCSALTMNVASSPDHGMMSICRRVRTRPPARAPRMPTQADQIELSWLNTPILAREPGSRAQALISITPS
jgi:hypothetical protein